MEDVLPPLFSLLSEGNSGGYEIFYEDELYDALPQDLRNRKTLEAALTKLTADGYIDVKYSRGDAFCIAVLKAYEPPSVPPTAEPNKRRTNVKAYAYTALAAFLGGALGGCVAAVIATLL